MKDVFVIQEAFKNTGLFESVDITDINPGTGIVNIDLTCSEEVYTEVVEEILGGTLDDKATCIETIQDMKVAKDTYNKVGNALSSNLPPNISSTTSL